MTLEVIVSLLVILAVVVALDVAYLLVGAKRVRRG